MDTKKKIGIWGLGAVGQSAIKHFGPQNMLITALDVKVPAEGVLHLIAKYNVHCLVQTGKDSVINFLETNDYIVVSPGIDTREYSKYQHKYLNELDIFTDLWHKKIIGITGSVGKTTITHLLSQLMKYAEIPVATGGNIGTPMLDLLEEQQRVDYAVLELSSFQLEQSHTCAPNISIITNLYPNHLDRHGSMEQYAQAKQHIFNNHTSKHSLIIPYELLTSTYYSTALQTYPGNLYIVSSSDIVLNKEHIYKYARNTIALYTVDKHNQGIIRHTLTGQKNDAILMELSNVPTSTMLSNWLVLIAVLDILELEPNKIIHDHKNTLSLPEDRLEYVGTFRDCVFLNDSKATIPHATLEACATLHDKSILLIIGGLSKGVDRSSMIKALPKNVNHVICFGKEAQQLGQWCADNNKPADVAQNLEECLAVCKDRMKPGMVVLFSPSGSSFDLFTNYHERGTLFKKLVRAIFT